MGSPGTERQNPFMHQAIRHFVEAHERYQALDSLRTECSSPQQREHMHIALLRAYLEVQYHACIITQLQTANGSRFAQMN